MSNDFKINLPSEIKTDDSSSATYQTGETIDGKRGGHQALISGSSMLFSSFVASLADGEEIDSGWLDMAGVDKYQFTGSSSSTGMTVDTLSRATEGQDALVTSSAYNEGTFFLFNAICRQRFMRFKWRNTTGATVTNVSLEIKGTHGSSDKLSVFPLSSEPTIFSQAALVQAVLKGENNIGAFSSVRVNEFGVLSAADFLFDVARNLYEGVSEGEKFGRNPEVDVNTPNRDVWHGGRSGAVGLYSGFNATASENIEVFSDSNNDSGSLVSSGTATGGSANTIVDSSATFVTDGVAVGDLVINDTGAYHGKVSEVTSETTLTVFDWDDTTDTDGFIPTSGDSYRVATASSTGAAVTRWDKILDSDYVEQTPVYIIMNGTTGVIGTTNAMRCSRGRVVLAGSLETSADIITCRQETTTANVFATMPTETNATSIACDTVPAGITRIAYGLQCRCTRVNGASGSAVVRFMVRKLGGLFTSRINIDIGTDSPYEHPPGDFIILKEKTDFKWNVASVSDNNTFVSAKIPYVDFVLQE